MRIWHYLRFVWVLHREATSRNVNMLPHPTPTWPARSHLQKRALETSTVFGFRWHKQQLESSQLVDSMGFEHHFKYWCLWSQRTIFKKKIIWFKNDWKKLGYTPFQTHSHDIMTFMIENTGLQTAMRGSPRCDGWAASCRAPRPDSERLGRLTTASKIEYVPHETPQRNHGSSGSIHLSPVGDPF